MHTDAAFERIMVYLETYFMEFRTSCSRFPIGQVNRDNLLEIGHDYDLRKKTRSFILVVEQWRLSVFTAQYTFRKPIKNEDLQTACLFLLKKVFLPLFSNGAEEKEGHRIMQA